MKDAMDELVQKYFLLGYPSAEELVAAQGLTFPRDPRDLLGNFWPEEESIDDFLAAMRAAACNTLPSRRMADGRDALRCRRFSNSLRVHTKMSLAIPNSRSAR